MEIKFSNPFEKDLKGIMDKWLVLEVEKVIGELKRANSLHQVKGIKKLKGHKNCYRISLGDYRLGFVVVGKFIWLARLMNRKDIYKYFP